MTSFISLVTSSLWYFYFDICERHILSTRASTPVLKFAPNPCAEPEGLQPNEIPPPLYYKETCEKKENNNSSNNDALLCWYKRSDQTQNRILFLYLGRFVFVYFVYFGWGVEPVACPYRRGSLVIISVILPSLECNYFAPMLKLLLEGFILSCMQWFQKNFFCCPH